MSPGATRPDRVSVLTPVQPLRSSCAFFPQTYSIIKSGEKKKKKKKKTEYLREITIHGFYIVKKEKDSTIYAVSLKKSA